MKAWTQFVEYLDRDLERRRWTLRLSWFYILSDIAAAVDGALGILNEPSVFGLGSGVFGVILWGAIRRSLRAFPFGSAPEDDS